jgi:predicted kinase
VTPEPFGEPAVHPDMDLVIFIGLQATGKSTFYQERFSGRYDLISKDRFRNARRPQARQMRLLEEALTCGRSAVIDNTNATRDSRAPLIEQARRHGAVVTGYYFESRIEESLRRNQGREGKSRVPDVAIYSTLKKLERPTLNEGFDRLFHVRLSPTGGFDVTEGFDEEP